MKPYDIAQIFAQMEIDLIASMKRNLSRHEAWEKEEGFEWEQWQSRKLAGLKQYRKENRKLLQKYGGAIDTASEQMIKESFLHGASGVDGTIRRLWERLKSLFASSRLTVPITAVDGTDDSFFRINEKRLNSLITATKQDLDKGMFAMLRQTEDVYRQTIFKTQVYHNAGASSLGQAIDRAKMDFISKGINCITYADGRRVNIASYAEMALRTTSQRAVFMGEGARRGEWGVKTVVVSAHSNSSDLCLPWQGKVYIDDVYSGGKAGDGKYPLLSGAMSAGLFHPNCRHNMSTFFPGISSLPAPVDNGTASENYKAEQQQRYMERQVRKYKRREAGSIDPANQVAATAKVKQWEDKIKGHMTDNLQLRRDQSREKVQGGISGTQRKEVLKKLANTAKIEGIRKHIRSDQQPKNIDVGQHNKHAIGTHEYKQKQKDLNKKGEFGPSYLTISQDEVAQMVKQYAGTGGIKLNKNGVWDNKETILTNDTIIGKAVNNLTGAEADTTVFRIHYGKNEVHIVPDYPSKKKGRENK
ncbi:hypothetical protein J2T13_004944 [Paenibacillus sp. DS2015]|uniref:phage minor capsid protein n=1 Tax=Paenibacillus sp. DS2015 TaxID=3373917 RepID=UPI003D222B96